MLGPESSSQDVFAWWADRKNDEIMRRFLSGNKSWLRYVLLQWVCMFGQLREASIFLSTGGDVSVSNPSCCHRKIIASLGSALVQARCCVVCVEDGYGETSSSSSSSTKKGRSMHTCVLSRIILAPLSKTK